MGFQADQREIDDKSLKHANFGLDSSVACARYFSCSCLTILGQMPMRDVAGFVCPFLCFASLLEVGVCAAGQH